MNNFQQSSVLFVCLGNICRSPTAHGVFQQMLERRDLGNLITVDSCGTGDWHIGGAPDPRAAAEALKRGYDLSTLRARQLNTRDFDTFDYILAMDEQNLADIRSMCPIYYSGHTSLFLDYAPQCEITEVPDPYYGGAQGFAQVLDLVEAASEGLLQEIRSANPG